MSSRKKTIERKEDKGKPKECPFGAEVGQFKPKYRLSECAEDSQPSTTPLVPKEVPKALVLDTFNDGADMEKCDALKVAYLKNKAAEGRKSRQSPEQYVYMILTKQHYTKQKIDPRFNVPLFHSIRSFLEATRKNDI